MISKHWCTTLMARFIGPTWGPSGADRTQVSPMLAPWTLLSGQFWDMVTRPEWSKIKLNPLKEKKIKFILQMFLLTKSRGDIGVISIHAFVCGCRCWSWVSLKVCTLCKFYQLIQCFQERCAISNSSLQHDTEWSTVNPYTWHVMYSLCINHQVLHIKVWKSLALIALVFFFYFGMPLKF